ncbi:NifB/NifX family molybdenum-iron cluster-binding protein [Tolumonas lignilytica]|jgi:Dinitrogenase iron-molybdenum cofactor.|uniref:NifB/NifX family molybdenum-iron cluster-binding protein n=1 Tax=Tolumonas lignilytica TaxID=1283284 RepID=UPI0004B64345|nr:NifB/NifX family molybdenum-iron cluster-binding protein [Tolumonas lignilytica]
MKTLLESQVYWRLIALAQAVPEVEQGILFDWISGALNGPLTTAQLEKLTVEALKSSAPSELSGFSQARWQVLLECLQGELPVHLDPKPAVAEPDALRVAFSSNDGLHVNGHFGNCHLFFIYQVTEAGSQLIDIRHFVADETQEDNETRARLLQNCHLLFCEAIGGPAAARIIRHGIHPVKIKKDNRISTQLDALQELMQGQLPPWLAKALGRKDDLGKRFNDELSELE